MAPEYRTKKSGQPKLTASSKSATAGYAPWPTDSCAFSDAAARAALLRWLRSFMNELASV